MPSCNYMAGSIPLIYYIYEVSRQPNKYPRAIIRNPFDEIFESKVINDK